MCKRSRQLMWEQLIPLDSGTGESLQMQLRKGLTSAILQGHVNIKLPLPSSRELARQLGVSRNTVVLSYQRLVDEGYLISRERRGHFVNPVILDSAPFHQDEYRQEGGGSTEWSGRLNFDLSRQRNINKPADWQSYQYPFIYGQSDPTLFPIADWRECVRQSQSVSLITSGSFDYIDQDDEILAEELCSRVLPRRGIWSKTDKLLVTIGAQNALALIAQLLLNKHSVIGMENPGYPDARNLFLLHSGRLVLLDTDEHGLIVNEKLAQCDYVYVTPGHQSPTTVTLSRQRRQALLDRARQYDLIIIEDDYESETNFIQKGVPALKSMDKDNRVIYCGSLSKSLAPGLRLGFLIADEEFILNARMLRRLLLRHPPALVQRTVALFLQLGHYDSHISRLNQVLKKRWEIMGEAIEEHLPNSTHIPKFGGSAFWMQAKETINTMHLAEACAKQSILIEPGNIHFGEQKPPQNYFRLGFSSIAEDRIKAGIVGIKNILDQLGTSKNALFSR